MSLLGKCYSCDRKVWSDDGPEIYMVGGECNDCAGEVLCSYCEKETVYREYGDKCKTCGRETFDCGYGICNDCLAISSCGHCGADIGRCCFDDDAAVKADKNKCCHQDLCKNCLKNHKAMKDLLPCGHPTCKFVDSDEESDDEESESDNEECSNNIDKCLTCHLADEAIKEEENKTLDKTFLEGQLQHVKSKLGKELLEDAIKKLVDNGGGKEATKKRKISE